LSYGVSEEFRVMIYQVSREFITDSEENSKLEGML